MSNRRKFDDLAGPIDADPERRRRVERIAAEMEHEWRLAEIRQARQLTQQQLAASLDTTQGGVSRLERQTDLYLSTLRSYIEAMGGVLEVVARFGDERIPIRIGDPPAAASPS